MLSTTIIIISLCIKRQSTGQQPRQPNARRAARPEIEFLCSHRLQMYVRHRLNFSAAATWVRRLLPTNHVGGATALYSHHHHHHHHHFLLLKPLNTVYTINTTCYIISIKRGPRKKNSPARQGHLR